MGAVGSLITGNDPLMGAALGGVTGGMFGGAEGFGSGFGEGGLFADGGLLGNGGMFNVGDMFSPATETASASLGSGGFQTINPYTSGVDLIPPVTNQITAAPGSIDGAMKFNPATGNYIDPSYFNPTTGEFMGQAGSIGTDPSMIFNEETQSYINKDLYDQYQPGLFERAYDWSAEQMNALTPSDYAQGGLFAANKIMEPEPQPEPVNIQQLLPNAYTQQLVQQGNQFSPLNIKVPRRR